MSGIINLWRNECIKLFRQTANRVIIIIALVLSIILPFAASAVSRTTFSYDQSSEDFMMYYEECEDELDKVDFLASAQVQQFYETNELAEWKKDKFYNGLRQAYLLKNVCEAVLDGKVDKQQAYDMYAYLFESELDAVYDPEIIVQDEYFAKSYDVYEQETVDADLIDFQSFLDHANERIAENEKALPEMTIKDYANGIVKSYEEQLKEEKLLLNELNTMYEDDKTTLTMVNQQKLTIEVLEFEISISKALADTDTENEDWMFDAMSGSVTAAKQSLLSNFPVDKETYLEEYANFSDKTYDEYVEECERQQSYAREALIMIQYSFENGIPLPNSVEHSTKQIVHFCLGGLSSIVVIVMVVITATTIAGEYSQGTIRLLLIRPRTKTKIILSKFLALLTAGVLLTVVGFILVYLVSVLVNGINDIFVVDLMYSSRVIEINAIVYSIVKLFLPVFSGILLIALAFMMAVVTRKAMLSIVLPVIISMSSVIVQILSVVGIEKYPFLKMTVLPYLDLGNYLVSPLSTFSGDMSIVEMLFGGMSSMLFSSAGISLLYGVIVVAVHILILFIVSFVVFKRQEIKN